MSIIIKYQRKGSIPLLWHHFPSQFVSEFTYQLLQLINIQLWLHKSYIISTYFTTTSLWTTWFSKICEYINTYTIMFYKISTYITLLIEHPSKCEVKNEHYLWFLLCGWIQYNVHVLSCFVDCNRKRI